jgi:hypothetical protein
MGTFLLQTTTVKKKKKTKDFLKLETVKVELEFISNGNTSDFSEGEILILIMDKLKELKNPTINK